MSIVNLANIDAVGVDVAVTTISGATAVALPCHGTLVMIKNVGANEAFVRVGPSTVSVATASAASGMSIPAGAIEVFRSSFAFTHVAAICGTSTTTLRVYPTEGK